MVVAKKSLESESQKLSDKDILALSIDEQYIDSALRRGKRLFPEDKMKSQGYVLDQLLNKYRNVGWTITRRMNDWYGGWVFDFS